MSDQCKNPTSSECAVLLALSGEGSNLFEGIQLVQYELGRQQLFIFQDEIELLLCAGRIRLVQPGSHSSLVAYHDVGDTRHAIPASELGPWALLGIFVRRFLTQPIHFRVLVYDRAQPFEPNFDVPGRELVLWIAGIVDSAQDRGRGGRG
jgi:hypothetical protein